MYTKVELTSEQKYMMSVTRVGFMNACPFYAYYYHSELQEYPTTDIPTAGTDMRRIYYNPEYLMTLRPSERIAVIAHEVSHVIFRHPARMRHYGNMGNLRGLPWVPEFFNVCCDLPINAGLVENKIGELNPSWLYDPKIGPDALPEDIYEKHFPKTPPQGGSGGNKPDNGFPTAGAASGMKGGKPDKQAQARGGNFDDLLPPQVDPVSGREDAPSEAEFKEAVARAAAAAKAMGKLPAGIQRMVDEILEPQVDWREHIRMLITGKIGHRHESWTRLNRRRLVLNPIVILPGRAGYGADNVAVAIDTSGSIGEKELAVFLAEVGGVISDCRPKRVTLLWCDAAVHRVDEASTLDDLAHIRTQGAPGGGGTSFVPVFERIAEDNMRPEVLIYLTDMYGEFPKEAPGYPVIWAATSDKGAPFGEIVRIKV